jgi:tetratricopeptide (TPR) repeat protein
MRAGRIDAARAQLAEAGLLDEENATAEALRGWADLAAGDRPAARAHLTKALEWGPWSDLARILLGAVEQQEGRADAAREAWAPVRDRIARKAPPEYVYRPKLATWESVHELPAVERELLSGYAGP